MPYHFLGTARLVRIIQYVVVEELGSSQSFISLSPSRRRWRYGFPDSVMASPRVCGGGLKQGYKMFALFGIFPAHLHHIISTLMPSI